MSDKLDWLNQHFVLFHHKKVQEVVEQENYKLPFELKELAKKYPIAEDFVKELHSQKQYKLASEFLAYNLHQRALDWWGYCVVLSLMKELQDSPSKPRDIADIGKPKTFDIPDWAKMPEDHEKPFDEKFAEELAKLEGQKQEAEKKAMECLDMAGPEAKELFLAAKKIVWDAFKKECGYDPEEFVQKSIDDAIKLSKTHVDFDETKTPIYKSSEELKAKIEKIRQETIDTIKKAVPQKSTEELKTQKASAMDAAYSFIVAPNDANAKRCLAIGNTCPDIPEGLLCLICFWSFGNLTPDTEQVVKTPAGLASNGLNSLLLMCSLADGGTRQFDERVKLYFNIGLEIGFGINSFSDFLKNSEMPHHLLSAPDSFDGYIGREQSSEKSKTEEKIVKTKTTTEYVRFKV